ncbi:hypothetical protein [Glaciibacter superstes]|uniref:hypothetical protein n=1 Tax=Glaciibacter superstes TaxID=501023 RepID=UPI0003B72835|nr:hypothetical protein [Glaciibacter superstes]
MDQPYGPRTFTITDQWGCQRNSWQGKATPPTQAFAVKVAPAAELYPYLARSLAELLGDGGYAFADEFDYGLELLLEGLERRVADAAFLRR